MAGLPMIAMVASVAGTAISAVGSIASGNQARQAAEYQAAQYELQAKNARATAQRDAMEYGRNLKLAQSNIQANAAGSGFSATDTGTLDLLGDVTAHGTLQQQMAQYSGDNQAAGYNAAAKSSRATGRAAQTAGYFNAAGTVLSGASTLYDNYAKGLYSAKNPYGAAGGLPGFG